MSARTYGDFDFIPEDMIPEAQFGLTLQPIDLTAHWRRCGLVSDTVASFIAYAYTHQSIEHAPPHLTGISTVFQELLENAAKYSRKRESGIQVRVRHYARAVMLEVQNGASKHRARGFEQHVRQLLRASAEELDALFVETLEASRDNVQSGIGILLLLKDYDVKIGVRFEPEPRGARVTIRVFYTLAEKASDDAPADAAATG